MNKFYGKIGYVETVETPADSGIWVETATEQYYYGDIIKNTKNVSAGVSINDNITVNNQISIVSDPYANNHFFAMRYVEWMGALWKITNVEVQRPRLILTIGGIYNGITPSASSETQGDS